MPGEDLGKRIIFLELGPLLRKPSGLWVCITDDTRERGRRMFWSQVICALIVAGPWFWAGSLSTCLRIICSLTCAGILWTACDLLPCRPSCWRRRLILLALDKTICKSTFAMLSYTYLIFRPHSAWKRSDIFWSPKFSRKSEVSLSTNVLSSMVANKAGCY